jgi:glyoxalase family protein
MEQHPLVRHTVTMRRGTHAVDARAVFGRPASPSPARAAETEAPVSDVVGRVRTYLSRDRPERRRGLDRRTGVDRRRRDEGTELERRSGEDRRSGRDRRAALAGVSGGAGGNSPDDLGVGTGMNLHGIHHVTCITGDARRNVDFYTRVLGLRLVKKTVNQDDPTVYHLFYADDRGSAGADLTFFEYPGARPGRAGAGMVHLIAWRLGSEQAVDFWERRLRDEGVGTRRDDGSLAFADPEGLAFELRVVETDDPPLVASHPGIPEELAIQGFDAVRAYASDPARSDAFLDALAFKRREDGWEARGGYRGGTYHYDQPPAERGVGGAGTVHHVAWATPMDEHAAWVERVAAAGGQPTPVIDRFWFRSIYFREPNGILFELASLGPGFDIDEPLEHLGESLILPPRFEPLRGRIEQVLTPL